MVSIFMARAHEAKGLLAAIFFSWVATGVTATGGIAAGGVFTSGALAGFAPAGRKTGLDFRV